MKQVKKQTGEEVQNEGKLNNAINSQKFLRGKKYGNPVSPNAVALPLFVSRSVSERISRAKRDTNRKKCRKWRRVDSIMMLFNENAENDKSASENSENDFYCAEESLDEDVK